MRSEIEPYFPIENPKVKAQEVDCLWMLFCENYEIMFVFSTLQKTGNGNNRREEMKKAREERYNKTPITRKSSSIHGARKWHQSAFVIISCIQIIYPQTLESNNL